MPETRNVTIALDDETLDLIDSVEDNRSAAIRRLIRNAYGHDNTQYTDDGGPARLTQDAIEQIENTAEDPLDKDGDAQ